MNLSNEQNELLNQIRLGEDSVLEFKAIKIQGKRILGSHSKTINIAANKIAVKVPS